MSNELTRRNLETSLELGSLKALVRERADNPMILLDYSGSMGALLRNGKRRIDALREVVATLGDVPKIAFSDDVFFLHDGARPRRRHATGQGHRVREAARSDPPDRRERRLP